jgi:hypothetical protein
MSAQGDDHAKRNAHDAHHHGHVWSASDAALEKDPPSRIELARQRMLIARLYLGLLQTVIEDYGSEFAAQSDSLTYRTIGIYVFLRTVICSPVRASEIAPALKLPRGVVSRRLQELRGRVATTARISEGRLHRTCRQRLSRYREG